jgi:C4-dicarboxylate-binding protein DctP
MTFSNSRRRATVTVAGLISAALIGSMAHAAPTLKLRMVGYMPVKNDITVAMERFKAEVEKKSNGSISVDHFPSGALFKASSQHQAVSSGQVDIGYGATSWLADQLPVMSIFDVPFLFNNQKQVETALNGELGDALSKAAERADLRIIGWLDLGPANALGTNKRLVKVPADLQGLRIRGYGVFPSMTIQLLGGAPTTVDTAETYSALQYGVVDGAVSLASSFHDRKWSEVIKNLTIIPLGYFTFPVYVNKTWWDKLPADQKAILTAATREASKYTYEASKKSDANALEAIRKSGRNVYVVPESEFGVWRDALKGVFDEFTKQSGADGRSLLQIARKYQ